MSYVVSITRANPTLSRSEVEEVIRSDPSFTLEEAHNADTLVATWRESPTARSEAFVFADESIDVTTPTHAALGKMQQIAVALHASVTGEGGEDLTDVEVEARSTVGGTVAGLLVLAVLAAGVIRLLT